MDTQTIKQQLKDSDVVKILDALDCQHIKLRSGYVTSTRGGDSDNKTGVVVYLDDLRCLMPTTPEFDKLPVKDIFSVVQIVKECSFPNAVRFVCDVIGIEYDGSKPAENFLTWLSKIEHGNSSNPKQQTILDYSILDSFIELIPDCWRNEGVVDPLDLFKIRYDLDNDVIIIPIVNSFGELVGVKCRTMDESADNKYWYLYPCEKTKVLYGAYQNYDAIMKAGEVIIYESEKSVIKSCSAGVNNCVAVAGKKISTTQAEEIVRMGCDVVVALDMDVSDEEIYTFVKQLSFPVALNNVYILKDRDGMFLGDKDSPADSEDFVKDYSYFKEIYLRKGDSL